MSCEKDGVLRDEAGLDGVLRDHVEEPDTKVMMIESVKTIEIEELEYDKITHQPVTGCQRRRSRKSLLLAAGFVLVVVVVITLSVTLSSFAATSTNSPPQQLSKEWTPLGNTLTNSTWKDVSLALSDDGSIVAVGNRNHPTVGVYHYNPTLQSWQPMGTVVEGKDDSFGVSLALSADGTTLAVGGHLRSTGFADGRHVGHVKVYTYQREQQEWIQVGKEIVGEAHGDQAGIAVGLSALGHILAVGAHLNSETENRAGHVRVYEFVETQGWKQMGSDIDGQSAGDQFGGALALSDDGWSLAVGARFHDVISERNNTGHVQIYGWDPVVQMWSHRGSDIVGAEQDDEFGYSVALSGDGTTVAVGNAINQVSVHRFINGDWESLNSDGPITVGIEHVFLYVTLSATGESLAVLEKPRRQQPSRITVLQYDQGEYQQVGPTWTGAVVALAGRGTVLAIGSMEDGAETIRILEET
jgi:hypothetical protein